MGDILATFAQMVKGSVQDIFILPQKRRIQIGWNPRARAAQAQNMQDMHHPA
jgi:hypothetical protein